MDRRTFISAAAGSIPATGLISGLFAAAGPETKPAVPDKRIRKAVKIGMVGEGETLLDKFKIVKDLGFDGIELDSPNKLDLTDVLTARDRTGLPIHGVVDSVHWSLPFSHPEAEVRRKAGEALATAIRDAKDYGAKSVLLVPAIVNKQMSYDDAYKRSQEEIRKHVPLAAELGVFIAIENVWNNFLLSPLECARYIDELESPFVRDYFDVGNVVRSGWPEQWIRILGRRIMKIDIKEYSREKADKQGPGSGFAVELLEGDCDWPAVMNALRQIGFSGWATAEVPGGKRDRLKIIAERMDRIFAS